MILTNLNTYSMLDALQIAGHHRGVPVRPRRRLGDATGRPVPASGRGQGGIHPPERDPRPWEQAGPQGRAHWLPGRAYGAGAAPESESEEGGLQKEGRAGAAAAALRGV